jgi:hypothetical protein
VGDSICWKRAKTLGKTKNAERGDSRRFLLTVGSCFSVEKQKAPRKGPYSKQCAPVSGDMRLPNPLAAHKFPFSETQIGVIDR